MRQILSWNIRGSGSAIKKRAIKRVICKLNPDLVVLQEVRGLTVFLLQAFGDLDLKIGWFFRLLVDPGVF